MKNLLEDAIGSAYESVRMRTPEFCGCQQCHDDVISLALNHSRPRYATGNPPRGAVLTRLELQSEQGQAQLISVVYDAMQHVIANPRHTPPSGSARVV
jgi:competence protein ComFB